MQSSWRHRVLFSRVQIMFCSNLIERFRGMCSLRLPALRIWALLTWRGLRISSLLEWGFHVGWFSLLNCNLEIGLNSFLTCAETNEMLSMCALAVTRVIVGALTSNIFDQYFLFFVISSGNDFAKYRIR